MNEFHAIYEWDFEKPFSSLMLSFVFLLDHKCLENWAKNLFKSQCIINSHTLPLSAFLCSFLAVSSRSLLYNLQRKKRKKDVKSNYVLRTSRRAIKNPRDQGIVCYGGPQYEFVLRKYAEVSKEKRDWFSLSFTKIRYQISFLFPFLFTFFIQQCVRFRL